MVEKRQEVIFENGVRYRLLGDPDEARLYMRHARMTYDNLDMRNDPLIVDFAHSHHMTSSGASISATRNGHLQEVVIEAYAPVRISDEKKKIDRDMVDQRYAPAFHTYDSNKNFVGLTLCTSGKWGPPYRFIKCSEEEILRFEDGQWNTEYGAVRPDPEVYKTKRLKSFIYNGVEEDYYEIPAAHDYVSMATYNNGSSTAWSNHEVGGEEFLILICEEHEVSLGWAAPFVYNYGGTDVVYSLFVRTEFPADEWFDEYPPMPNVKDFTPGTATSNQVGKVRGNWCDTPVYPDACAYCMGEMEDAQGFNYEQYWDGTYPLSSGAMEFVTTTVTDSKSYSSYDLWGTFTGEEITDGVVFYQELNLQSTYNNIKVIGNSTPSGSYSVRYYQREKVISVFGKEYVMKDWTNLGYPVNNDWYTDKYAPRIYKLAGDKTIVLGSATWAFDDVFVYVCFRDGVEQYDDPAATYDYIEDLQMHRIGDGDGYGNGKFSLVKINMTRHEEIE